MPKESKSISRDDPDYEEKRKKNNEAIRKSREKAKQKQKETQEKVDALKEENRKVEGQIKEMEGQLKLLQGIFKTHANHSDGPNQFEDLLGSTSPDPLNPMDIPSSSQVQPRSPDF